jgi:hypothetical protein
MAENDELSFEQQLDLWGKIASQRLVKSIRKMGIGNTGALQRSLEHQIKHSQGDVSVAFFKFLKYGRFVDMGTGRGYARGDRSTAAFAVYRNDNGSLKNEVRRKPKPWYSRTMYREIKVLSEKLLANMSEQAMDILKARMRRINSHTSKFNPPKA